MKEYKIDQIRNLGLVGHGGVGKTSLAEALLFSAGITTRLGRVEDGTTTADYSPDEISRKISISASLMNLEWNKKKINLMDTPGFNIVRRIPVWGHDSNHCEIEYKNVRVPVTNQLGRTGTGHQAAQAGQCHWRSIGTGY